MNSPHYSPLRMIKSAQRQALIFALLMVHCLFLILSGIQHLGGLKRVELFIYDGLLNFNIRHLINYPTLANPEVLVVEWDETAQNDPVLVHQLPNLFEKIIAQRPRFIVLPFPLNNFSTKNSSVPFFFLNKLNQEIDLKEFYTDGDGKVRRHTVFATDARSMTNSVSLILANESAAIKQQNLELPKTLPLLTETFSFDSSFSSPKQQHQWLLEYGYYNDEIEILNIRQIQELNFSYFNKKIIFFNLPSSKTKPSIPSTYYLTPKGNLADITLYAYATAQLLNYQKDNDNLQPLSSSLNYMIVWLSCIMALVILHIKSTIHLHKWMLGGALVLMTISIFAFTQRVWFFPLFAWLGWSSCLWVIRNYQQFWEKQQQHLLTYTLGLPISEAVASIIWQDYQERVLQEEGFPPQRLVATLLTADLQMTEQSMENHDPQILMVWWKTYLENVTNLVERHHGMIYKLVGGSITIVFGLPLPRSTLEEICDDAKNAADCALALRREVLRLRQTEQYQDVQMRIGICTGLVVAGIVKPQDQRPEYTVLGESLYIASCLESHDALLDSQSACRILLSDSTLQHLQEAYETQPVGSLVTRGKRGTVRIHRLTGHSLTWLRESSL